MSKAKTLAQTVSTGVSVATTNGGTGQTGFTTGDILYSSATDTLAKLAIGSAGQVLKVTSGVPAWATDSTGSGTVTSVSWTGGIVAVATATSTPAFTIAGTSGGIPYFSSASTWASSTALTQYGVVYGGGAGAAPAATSAGTATHVLTSNGSGAPPTFQAPAGGTSFTAKTTTYTAVEGDTLLVDTSAGSFTITLPASPSTGKTVYFQDSKGTWFTYPLTIGRNGNTIMGVAENFIASSNNAGFGLVFNGSDWRVY
jgi:hypothetical protein